VAGERRVELAAELAAELTPLATNGRI